MFADTLTADQKDILVRVLCEIAQADQLVSVEEREVIVRYALSLGLNAEQIEQTIEATEVVPGEVLRALPETARRVILVEAQTLAMIDGDYDEVEAAKVAALAGRLSLESDVVREIDGYVRRGFEWALEGSKIVGAA
jgi:tellurite resistance protein